MKNNPVNDSSKMTLGLPRVLFWAFVALGIFMAGDGMEQAFLSKYIVNMGFSASQAASVFTIYGITVAFSSWLAALFARILGIRRTMMIGLVVWVVFQVGFLTLGIRQQNIDMMRVMYCFRGFGYPLFAYPLIVWVSDITPYKKLTTAMGWFWFAYSFGIGVLGAYVPSFTIPSIGYMGSLLLGLSLVIIGGLLGVLLTKEDKKQSQKGQEEVLVLKKGITLLFTNRKIAIASGVRVINQLAVYGLVVSMPVFLTSKEIGFTISQWLQIWAFMFFVNIIFNVIWGFVANKMAWHKVVQYFGCLGMAITCLLFYYIPISFGNNFWLMLVVSGLLGIWLAAFVPTSAMFPAFEPKNKGAAFSIHNLSTGLSQFIAPAITGLLMTLFGPIGVVWGLAVFYMLGFFLSGYLEVDSTEIEEYEKNEHKLQKAQ